MEPCLSTNRCQAPFKFKLSFVISQLQEIEELTAELFRQDFVVYEEAIFTLPGLCCPSESMD
jgi:hypothetical protein